jgi:carbon starvation protein CstA
MGMIPEIALRDPASMLHRHPGGEPIIPMLFVTIACGIISGFHSCQSPIVARTMTSERQGRSLYYGMMVCEGLIGMIWAAGGLALYAHKPELLTNGNGAFLLRELVSWLLNPAIAQLTILGVVVLAITSGDTALRSLRLAIAEYFGIDQKPAGKRLATTLPIFAAVTALLVWSSADPDTFKILWNYFSWSNQIMAVFALLVAVSYLRRQRKPALAAALPALFMVFIVLDYILFVSPEAVKGAPLGFGLPSGLAALLAAAGALVVVGTVFLVNSPRKGSAV